MPVTRRSFIAGSALSGTLLGLGMPRPAHTATHTFGGHAFGSTWRVTSGTSVDERHFRPAIEAVLQNVDFLMSPWRDDSVISGFNRLHSTDWQTLPQEVCHVVTESLNIASLTDGAFDPTVGPAVARFGFGPIEGGAGSYGQVAVQGDAIRKANADLTLDLCGIAKGHALDQIKTLLRREGVTNALIEVGGEVTTLGHHPSGRPWRVAIEHPGGDTLRAYRVVMPQQLALASSGHAPRGFRGRIQLSHLIDPTGQRPANNDLASVSVLAPTATQADALATAFAVLGHQRGVARASELGVSALFLAHSENGLTETMTGSFADHVVA